MAKKTLEQIKADIKKREEEQERIRQNRVPSGAAANPFRYNKKFRERALRTASNYSRARMGGSHNSSFDNPLAARLGEQMIFDYLINEGFADSASAAMSIMSVMSDKWKENIIGEYEEIYEGKGSRPNTSQDAEEFAYKLGQRASRESRGNPLVVQRYQRAVVTLQNKSPSGTNAYTSGKRGFQKGMKKQQNNDN